MVDLNVIAVDSHGEPVGDLTSDDFQVIDAGKKENIAFFHHRDNSRWQLPALAQNEFSNRGGARIPYATVVLFDLLNEGFGTRGYAASEIVHTLENLETADYLFLYFLTVDGRLVAVHGLPDTGEVSHSASDEPWTRQIKPLMEDSLRKVNQFRPVDIDVAARVVLTFQGLQNLAVQLSRVPGRKNIVWVTDGVPIALGPVRSDTGDLVDFTPQVRQLGEALDRSGVAIYPVRQVILGSADAIGDTSGSGQTGGAGTGLQSEETLNQFAGMTGGRPTTGKDIATVLKQAMNDLRTSYQIGYYPPQENWNNKFHKLRVTCKRKGIRIQAKTGYYAWAQPPGTRTQQAFGMAASTKFDAAEIGLRASVSFDPQDGRVAHFDLRIDAGDVALAQEGNDYLGQLRLTVVHYLKDGGTESEPVIPFDLHYNAQQRDAALKDGIDFTQNVPIGRSGYQLRIMVFDRGSNAIGSLTIPDHDNSRLVLPQLKAR
jgi:VWFA-related protein